MDARINQLEQYINHLYAITYAAMSRQQRQTHIRSLLSSFHLSPEDVLLLRRNRNNLSWESNEEEIIYYAMMLRPPYYDRTMGLLLQNGADRKIVLKYIDKILDGNELSSEPLHKLVFLVREGVFNGVGSVEAASTLLAFITMFNIFSFEKKDDRLKMIKYLVKKLGADVNYEKYNGTVLGKTLMHKKDDPSLIKFLIENGADVDHPSVNLMPLMISYTRANNPDKPQYANIIAMMLHHSKNPMKMIKNASKELDHVYPPQVRKSAREKLEQLQLATGLQQWKTLHSTTDPGMTQARQRSKQRQASLLEQARRNDQTWLAWLKKILMGKQKLTPQQKKDVLEGLHRMNPDMARQLYQMLGTKP